MGKTRLDELLVARGHFASKEQAARACIAGAVRSQDTLLTKPGLLVDKTIPIQLKEPRRYVSRGGDKLAGALDDFNFSAEGLHCIDIGASSGGFTDCLLQRGAASVTAVDVNYGQLAWQIRCDERVTVFERTNIRYVNPSELGAPFDLAVVDVSFIGLRGILSDIEALLSDSGSLIALVKPQFELHSADVGHGGVVTDPEAHIRALDMVLNSLSTTSLTPQGLTFSRVKGPQGNIEFFLWAQRNAICATIATETVVRQAHGHLDS